MEKKRRVLIVAGGTGGHIVPAVVFGRWMEKNQGREVACLSGNRPLEREIYGSFGIEPQRLSLEGSPLGVRSPLRVLRRLFGLARALVEAARCVARIQPEACILFGGYVSLPPLLVCRIRRIPVVVHEQNAVAGRVTRLAFRWGAAVAAGWEECAGVRNFLHVGIPVRPPGRLLPPQAREALGVELPEGERIVGVAGGSLGSEELMRKVLGAAEEFEKSGAGVTFLFLGARPERELPSNVRFVGRRWDLNPFYSLCDVLICRGGGSTLAETLSWGIPAVVIPWEKAAGGHQERNARCFEKAGGGIVWRENENVPLERALKMMLVRKKLPAEDTAAETCPALWSLLDARAEKGL